ncbi:MAG: chemotaxis protein CheA [Phycisphaerae bacterium]|nr:chemotaxis protein CheA [Phycisphaerae bacterium]
MTDTIESITIDGLVDQLALSSALCDVGDLGELAKMHSQVAELTKRIEEGSQFNNADEFSTFGAAVGTLLEGIVLEAYSDLEDILETVRQAISEIQSSLKGSPESAPLPSDKEFVAKVCRMAGGEPPVASTSSEIDPKELGGTADDQTSSASDEGESAAGDSGAAPVYVSEPLILGNDELEYVRSFATEAAEHIDAIEGAVLDLEQSLEDMGKINELFRPFHTIKGMAGFLNLRDIQELTHKGETLLDLARKGQLKLTPDHIDLIFGTVDVLKVQVDAVETYLRNPNGEPIPQPDITQALDRLHRAANGDIGGVSKDAASASQGASEAEAAATKITDESEVNGSDPEQTGAPETIGTSQPGLAVQKAKTTPKKDITVRLETAKLDHLVNMVGELVIAQAMVNQNPLLESSEKLTKDVSQVTKITREVQEITMALRMVTLQQTFQKMARLARDVGRKAGKQVEFSMTGEDTELDKNVIDEIGDPLMHMVRNAVDHGIESPSDRRAAGKPEFGSVHLHAAHVGGNIVIEITDDGGGLDRDKLIAKGIERGLLTPEDQLSDSEAFALIMQAGFSTAEKVTDISGRGVGMDVVKRNIEKLRGKVEISSEKGKGSKFTIRLPLTLAIIDGMVVTVGEERFIIPTISIDQSMRPEKDQVVTVQKRGEMLQVRGELCPLIRLDELFGIQTERLPVWERMVVIVVVDGRRVGIVLDNLIGQQQIVIKSLGGQFRGVDGISGGAILGDGKVGLILDAAGLVATQNGHRAA